MSVAKSREKRVLINDQITANVVRLIDADGEQVGVISIEEALKRAENQGMDLVQMAEGDIVVCKLMDYGRHRFKRKKVSRNLQKRMQVKEIKFRPNIGGHDYEIKLRNVRKFLEDGDKVKVTVRFRGREMMHQEQGVEMLQKLSKDVEDIAVVENAPDIEGRQIVMVLLPSSKKGKAKLIEGDEQDEQQAKDT